MRLLFKTTFLRLLFYKKMRPVANQQAKLFATAKTHKFNNIEDINVEELIFRPIIDQTGTLHTVAVK